MRTLSVMVLLGAVGFLSGCHDDPPKPTDPCTYCEDLKEAKKYFLFDVGSWWVYEEEVTHERDSIYVTQAWNDPESPDFDTYLYSSYQGYYYNFFPLISIGTNCSNPYGSYKKCIYIKNSKFAPGDYVGEENCFFMQYFEGANTPCINVNYTDNKIIFQKIYENYSSGSLSFLRTLKVHTEHSSVENNSPTNHYYVKGVGLIRKEILDSNQVWNLVDYSVTQ